MALAGGGVALVGEGVALVGEGVAPAGEGVARLKCIPYVISVIPLSRIGPAAFGRRHETKSISPTCICWAWLATHNQLNVPTAKPLAHGRGTSHHLGITALYEGLS